MLGDVVQTSSETARRVLVAVLKSRSMQEAEQQVAAGEDGQCGHPHCGGAHVAVLIAAGAGKGEGARSLPAVRRRRHPNSAQV